MDAPLQVARRVRMKRRDRWKKVMEVSLGLSLSMPLSLSGFFEWGFCRGQRGSGTLPFWVVGVGGNH